jgi:hypothetical protein
MPQNYPARAIRPTIPVIIPRRSALQSIRAEAIANETRSQGDLYSSHPGLPGAKPGGREEQAADDPVAVPPSEVLQQ